MKQLPTKGVAISTQDSIDIYFELTCEEVCNSYALLQRGLFECPFFSVGALLAFFLLFIFHEGISIWISFLVSFSLCFHLEFLFSNLSLPPKGSIQYLSFEKSREANLLDIRKQCCEKGERWGLENKRRSEQHQKETIRQIIRLGKK